MMDDTLTKRKILKFVKLLDGGDTEARLLEHAISRNWIDGSGAPTRDGRQMIHSFDQMSKLAETPNSPY